MAGQTELNTLIGRIALGDRGAFKQLYDATSPQVFGMLCGMVQREQAKELLQETYIRVWQNAGEYHCDRGQVSTWVNSIARYRALDVLRRKTLHVDASFDVDATPDFDTIGPETELAAAHDKQRLSQCIDALAEDQRRFIALAFFRGFSHDQIADVNAQPLGTIKSRIRRGLATLKRCLQP